MASVKYLSKDPRFLERLQMRREEQQRQLEYRAEQNRQAFKDFEAHRGKLEPHDREAIAAELYWEMKRYRDAHPQEKRYELVKKSGLDVEAESNKILDRLMLAPGADESKKKTLYADISKYFQLIRYLVVGDRSSETLDDPQQQEKAGRIFLHRTSFYPKSSGNVSNGNGESHLIYDALLGMVESVDREFHLYEQYMEIARLRAKRESIYWGLVVEKGEFPSPEAWHELDKELVLPQPGGPDTWLASEQRFNEENGLWWPLEDWRLTDEYDEPREPDSPFWALVDSIGPNAACVCSGEDFFFVPHVYLGLCIDTTTLGTFVDGTLDGLLDMPTPCASWDEASNRYKFTVPEYVLPDGGVSTDYLDIYEDIRCTARWLVIYPDPKTNKLVPMIYALGESPGAELTPLSPDLIADFGDPGRWKYFGDDAPTLLQRLKDLTGYRTDDFMAYKSWRETAARFHWNPILRKHPNSIEDIRYRKRLLYWRRHDQLEFSVNEEN